MRAASVVDVEHRRDVRQLLALVGMLVGHDGGPEGKELDHVAAPSVAVLVKLDLDDPEDAVADRLGLLLHPLHRQFARVVQRLRVLLELDVLTRLAHRLQHSAVSDVVHAVAHHQPHGALAGLHQGPEGLTGQVAGERAPVRRSMDLAAFVLDRGPDGDELRHVSAPLVAADVQADADDAVGPQLVGLLLHPRHGKLPGRVHRLAEDAHLLARLPVRLLKADVVDARPDHQPDRLKAGLLHAQVLVHREIGREQPARVHLQTLARVFGEPFCTRRIVGRHQRALLKWRGGLGAEVDRHGRYPERGRMRLVRAETDGRPEDVHRDDEEVLPVAGALVLMVIDLVRQGRDDHVVRSGLVGLTANLAHRQMTGRVYALGHLGHLLVPPP